MNKFILRWIVNIAGHRRSRQEYLRIRGLSRARQGRPAYRGDRRARSLIARRNQGDTIPVYPNSNQGDTIPVYLNSN